MRLSFAAARKYALISSYEYALINGIIYVHVLFIESKLRQVYLTKTMCTWSSVVRGLHICKRVQSSTVWTYTRRQNDDRFVACLQV